ncbi:hypothetical protein ANO11243_050290 [Dothideomycetidae sp. 11243]|nr:hypothetical protein ANO11243_050290 [fungal sp. No.11243]
MHTSWLLAALGATAAVAAPASKKSSVRTGPFTFPLPDGFPNPSAAQMQGIYKRAHGTLPNGALPNTISDTTAAVLELIATNELFEVGYFYDLISNMTNGVSGYCVGDKGLETQADYDLALRALKAIDAQEQLHALGANGILAHAGRATIVPCQYTYPVATFEDAITFASTFTDVVLGTLQEVIGAFAGDGDAELAPLIGSIIGNEAEQVGYFRIEHRSPIRIPSSLPFLTASSGPFANSLLNQQVLVPGSCPNASAIAKNVPSFPALTVVTSPVTLQTTTINYSFAASSVSAASGLSVAYINGQNVPVVEAVSNPSFANGKVTFSATFPGDLHGLTIVAVTKNAGPFTSASNVAANTVYGPGIIEL